MRFQAFSFRTGSLEVFQLVKNTFSLGTNETLLACFEKKTSYGRIHRRQEGRGRQARGRGWPCLFLYWGVDKQFQHDLVGAGVSRPFPPPPAPSRHVCYPLCFLSRPRFGRLPAIVGKSGVNWENWQNGRCVKPPLWVRPVSFKSWIILCYPWEKRDSVGLLQKKESRPCVFSLFVAGALFKC